jgi:hypothetical protein
MFLAAENGKEDGKSFKSEGSDELTARVGNTLVHTSRNAQGENE